MLKNAKRDIILALIIGEVSAWLLFFIIRNIIMENQNLSGITPYLSYLWIVFPILCALGVITARFLTKIIPVVYQLAKFVLVGGLNFLIDMGVLNFLIFYTGISAGAAQSGFKAISFSVAVLNSYFWNKFWVFESGKDKKTGGHFFQFIAVSLIGFVINLGADYLFVNMVSAWGGMPDKTWAQFSAMLAAFIALAWNFLGYKFLVFNNKMENNKLKV